MMLYNVYRGKPGEPKQLIMRDDLKTVLPFVIAAYARNRPRYGTKKYWQYSFKPSNKTTKFKKEKR